MMNVDYLHFLQEQKLAHYLLEMCMSNVRKISRYNIGAPGHGLHLIVASTRSTVAEVALAFNYF